MTFGGLGSQWAAGQQAAGVGVEIGGVWTRAFDRVRVRVSPEGVRLGDDESLRHEFFKAAIPLLSFVVAIALFVAAVDRMQADQPGAGWALVALGVLFLIPALVAAAVRALEPIMLVCCLLCAIVLLPFPAGRRTLGRWWRRIREEDPLLTPGPEIAAFRVGHSWRPRVDLTRHGRGTLHLYVRRADLAALTTELGRLGVPQR